jgi:tripartite ATP-independent transporter DctM subunit
VSPLLEITVVFAVFLGLLAAGMAVPFAIGVPGLVYLLLHGGLPALKGLGLMSWGSLNSFTLTAIPLFILMAEFIQRSGLSHRTYRGLAKLVAPVPGGLLQTNVASCAMFAAINGSSVATAATIGSVAIPQLKKRGYDARLSQGSLAAGGTLGILIPPSLAMIVYGSFTETSVAKLFMAGVVPGLLLTAMFMVYIAVHAKLRPAAAPKEPGPRDARELFRAIGDMLPFVFLIGGTMGTLYLGLATPTEAAALGCLLSIVISMIWGKLTWTVFVDSLTNAVRTVGNLLFIIYTAYIFAYAISVAGVGEQVTSFVVGLKLSQFEFFLALFLLYTLLGCLVESFGMIVITVPLLYPVLVGYGIDPIWFGIILVVFIELGQISPPIGINLFVIQSISRGKFSDVVMGTVPFHLIMFVLLLLLVAFPALALWLPAHMLGTAR